MCPFKTVFMLQLHWDLKACKTNITATWKHTVSLLTYKLKTSWKNTSAVSTSQITEGLRAAPLSWHPLQSRLRVLSTAQELPTTATKEPSRIQGWQAFMQQKAKFSLPWWRLVIRDSYRGDSVVNHWGQCAPRTLAIVCLGKHRWEVYLHAHVTSTTEGMNSHWLKQLSPDSKKQ